MPTYAPLYVPQPPYSFNSPSIVLYSPPQPPRGSPQNPRGPLIIPTAPRQLPGPHGAPQQPKSYRLHSPPGYPRAPHRRSPPHPSASHPTAAPPLPSSPRAAAAGRVSRRALRGRGGRGPHAANQEKPLGSGVGVAIETVRLSGGAAMAAGGAERRPRYFMAREVAEAGRPRLSALGRVYDLGPLLRERRGTGGAAARRAPGAGAPSLTRSPR